MVPLFCNLSDLKDVSELKDVSDFIEPDGYSVKPVIPNASVTYVVRMNSGILVQPDSKSGEEYTLETNGIATCTVVVIFFYTFVSDVRRGARGRLCEIEMNSQSPATVQLKDLPTAILLSHFGPSPKDRNAFYRFAEKNVSTITQQGYRAETHVISPAVELGDKAAPQSEDENANCIQRITSMFSDNSPIYNYRYSSISHLRENRGSVIIEAVNSDSRPQLILDISRVDGIEKI